MEVTKWLKSRSIFWTLRNSAPEDRPERGGSWSSETAAAARYKLPSQSNFSSSLRAVRRIR